MDCARRSCSRPEGLATFGTDDNLVARDTQVALWVGPCLVVLGKREVDVRGAAPVAALTQEGDRTLHLELARLLGNPLVRVSKNVLHLHARTPMLALHVSLPISTASNLAS